MEQPKDYQAALKAYERQVGARQQAEAETATVRGKLHSAIKKGKAIEAERKTLAGQLERLQQDVAELQAFKRQVRLGDQI